MASSTLQARRQLIEDEARPARGDKDTALVSLEASNPWRNAHCGRQEHLFYNI